MWPSHEHTSHPLLFCLVTNVWANGHSAHVGSAQGSPLHAHASQPFLSLMMVISCPARHSQVSISVGQIGPSQVQYSQPLPSSFMTIFWAIGHSSHSRSLHFSPEHPQVSQPFSSFDRTSSSPGKQSQAGITAAQTGGFGLHLPDLQSNSSSAESPIVCFCFNSCNMLEVSTSSGLANTGTARNAKTRMAANVVK